MSKDPPYMDKMYVEKNPLGYIFLNVNSSYL